MSEGTRPKRSGFVTLLWVIGGGLLLFMILGALLVWKVASDPGGRAGAGAVWEGVRTMWSAKSAPGTRELRKAGCEDALAMPLADVNRVMNLADAGARHVPPITLVTCTASLLRAPPACDALARVYAAAVRGGPPFMVLVQKAGTSPACEGRYASDGEAVPEATFYRLAREADPASAEDVVFEPDSGADFWPGEGEDEEDDEDGER